MVIKISKEPDFQSYPEVANNYDDLKVYDLGVI